MSYRLEKTLPPPSPPRFFLELLLPFSKPFFSGWLSSVIGAFPGLFSSSPSLSLSLSAMI